MIPLDPGGGGIPYLHKKTEPKLLVRLSEFSGFDFEELLLVSRAFALGNCFAYRDMRNYRGSRIG